MNERETQLIKHGSVAAVAREYGDEAAAATMQDLIDRSPMEVQGAWPLVIAWHRFQAAYEIADEMGDVKGMLAAADAQSKLVRDLH